MEPVRGHLLLMAVGAWLGVATARERTVPRTEPAPTAFLAAALLTDDATERERAARDALRSSADAVVADLVLSLEAVTPSDCSSEGAYWLEVARHDAALTALGAATSRAPELLVALLTDPGAELRATTASVLVGQLEGAGGEDEAVSLLCALLGSPDPEVRSRAARALALLGSEAQAREALAAEPLLAVVMTADRDARVRVAAAEALIALGRAARLLS